MTNHRSISFLKWCLYSSWYSYHAIKTMLTRWSIWVMIWIASWEQRGQLQVLGPKHESLVDVSARTILRVSKHKCDSSLSKFLPNCQMVIQQCQILTDLESDNGIDSTKKILQLQNLNETIHHNQSWSFFHSRCGIFEDNFSFPIFYLGQ